MHTRRQFVAAGGAAAAVAILAPEALASAAPPRSRRGGRFSEGVMSGEPTPGGITLWSRLHDVGGSVGAELEVARDRELRRVVARRRVATSSARGCRRTASATRSPAARRRSRA